MERALTAVPEELNLLRFHGKLGSRGPSETRTKYQEDLESLLCLVLISMERKCQTLIDYRADSHSAISLSALVGLGSMNANGAVT